MNFPKFKIRKLFFLSAPRCLLVGFGVLVSSKINHVASGGLDTSENPEIVEMRSFGLPP